MPCIVDNDHRVVLESESRVQAEDVQGPLQKAHKKKALSMEGRFTKVCIVLS